MSYGLVARQDFDRLFKFAFVRNPYDRLVSAWSWRCFPYRSSTFRDFVLNLDFWRAIDVGNHLRPQVEFIHSKTDGLLVDFVGRFEQINEDLQILADRIGVPDLAKQMGHQNRSRDPSDDYRRYYDEETRGIVRLVYAEDFRTFGYNTNLY